MKRVKELIAVLPEKDINIVKSYIDKRDFNSVLEIIESDIYKAERDNNHIQDGIPDDYILALTEMKGELLTYISYLEVPDNSNDYY